MFGAVAEFASEANEELCNGCGLVLGGVAYEIDSRCSAGELETGKSVVGGGGWCKKLPGDGISMVANNLLDSRLEKGNCRQDQVLGHTWSSGGIR